MNAAGSSQTSLGTIGLADWNVAGTGNGTAASWYEGNIQTCAAQGMRLPTLYETAATQPATTYQLASTPAERSEAVALPNDLQLVQPIQGAMRRA